MTYLQYFIVNLNIFSPNWLRIIKLCQLLYLRSQDRLYNLSEERFKALGPLVMFNNKFLNLNINMAIANILILQNCIAIQYFLSLYRNIMKYRYFCPALGTKHPWCKHHAHHREHMALSLHGVIASSSSEHRHLISAQHWPLRPKLVGVIVEQYTYIHVALSGFHKKLLEQLFILRGLSKR